MHGAAIYAYQPSGPEDIVGEPFASKFFDGHERDYLEFKRVPVSTGTVASWGAAFPGPQEGNCWAGAFENDGAWQEGWPQLKPTPHVDSVWSTPLLGDLAQIAPYPMAAALSHKWQQIQPATPNTDWGSAIYEGQRQGTYPTAITAIKTEPLDLPHYDFSAVDSEALYQEAQARVAERMAIFGRSDS